jgi:hypothetical protein
MKFFGAIVAYAVMAFFIGWGLLQAIHGNYWLLAAAVLGYLALFIKFGCLPPKSH